MPDNCKVPIVGSDAEKHSTSPVETFNRDGGIDLFGIARRARRVSGEDLAVPDAWHIRSLEHLEKCRAEASEAAELVECLPAFNQRLNEMLSGGIPRGTFHVISSPPRGGVMGLPIAFKLLSADFLPCTDYPVSYLYVPPTHIAGEPTTKVVDIPKGLQKLLKLSDNRGRVTRSHGPKKGRW